MNSQKLKTQSLYENLKAQILSKALPADSKLPSESELMLQYAVSRYSARKVIEMLTAEGLVWKRQGKGCFVNSHPSAPVLASASNQILLIASRAEHFYFLKSINGIEHALQNSGYTLTIRLSHYDSEAEASLLKEALMGNYAGFLIFPSESAYLYTNLYLYRRIEAQRIPCITLGNRIPCSSLPSVVTDDYVGGRLAAEYFIQNGHTSFVCLMNEEEYSGCMRYAGFLEGLYSASFSPSSHSVLWFGHQEKESLFVEREAQILALARQATAFFCFNDAAAVNLYRLLVRNHYQVPEDISVIGYDDSYLCETNPVPITALHQDPEAAGYAAAQNLLRLIKDGDYECSKTFLPYLVERNSVKNMAAGTTAFAAMIATTE